MATKAAFTLEDPYAVKVNDDYARITWANEQIYSVADGKHSLLSHILNGDIKVQKSTWGLNDTYDQAEPIRTTKALIKQLLIDGHIDMERLRNILSGGPEDDETVDAFIKSLTDAAKTPHRTKKPKDSRKVGEGDTETVEATTPEGGLRLRIIPR